MNLFQRNFLITLLCVPFILHSQANIDTTRIVTETGEVLTADEESFSDDKMVLKDQYDAARKELLKTGATIQEENRYITFLKDYQSQLESISNSKITDAVKTIETEITPANTEEHITAEANLRAELKKLIYSVDYSTYSPFTSNYGWNIASIDAEEMIADFSSVLEKNIDNSTVLKKFIADGYEMSLMPFITPANKATFKSELELLITRLGSIRNEAIEDEINKVNEDIKILSGYRRTCEAIVQIAKDKFNEKEAQINILAIKLGLPLFCGTILALFILPILLRRLRMRKRRHHDDCDDDGQGDFQGVILETCTVLLVTATILILGLAGKLSNEVLGTLIGGISGYVLNRMRTKKDDDQKENPTLPTITPTSTPDSPKPVSDNENLATNDVVFP